MKSLVFFVLLIFLLNSITSFDSSNTETETMLKLKKKAKSKKADTKIVISPSVSDLVSKSLSTFRPHYRKCKEFADIYGLVSSMDKTKSVISTIPVVLKLTNSTISLQVNGDNSTEFFNKPFSSIAKIKPLKVFDMDEDLTKIPCIIISIEEITEQFSINKQDLQLCSNDNKQFNITEDTKFLLKVGNTGDIKGLISIFKDINIHCLHKDPNILEDFTDLNELIRHAGYKLQKSTDSDSSLGDSIFYSNENQNSDTPNDKVSLSSMKNKIEDIKLKLKEKQIKEKEICRKTKQHLIDDQIKQAEIEKAKEELKLQEEMKNGENKTCNTSSMSKEALEALSLLNNVDEQLTNSFNKNVNDMEENAEKTVGKEDNLSNINLNSTETKNIANISSSSQTNQTSLQPASQPQINSTNVTQIVTEKSSISNSQNNTQIASNNFTTQTSGIINVTQNVIPINSTSNSQNISQVASNNATQPAVFSNSTQNFISSNSTNKVTTRKRTRKLNE